MSITYEDLRAAVGGEAVGVRVRTELEPLGGREDKVFPPTYGVSERAETRYAMEERRVDGQAVMSVVLDSVASQANRFELALLDAHRRNELALPVVSVDFRNTPVADLERISALEAPHRIFDALLRDSLLEGTLFRLSDVGKIITEATTRNAAPLYYYSPTTLLFGGWDSTGPRGGLGAKYERCLTSEVVAIGVTPGVTTSSRLDPSGIQLKAGPLYEAPDGTWTLNEEEAVKNDKGKPKPVARSGEGDKGRPSQVNHGNITPSIDARGGGVTAERLVATTVLSFAALRRLRFPLDQAGDPVPDDRRRQVETAAHTALATLGLAAVVLAFEEGFDLRSRCVLVPSTGPKFELLGRTGAGRAFALDRSQVLALVEEAMEASAQAGLSWMGDELLLRPTERLIELIVRSRRLVAVEPEAVDARG